MREIASGVRQITVGEILGCHVYLIDTPDGVIAFDGGVKGSGAAILYAAGGSIATVILSHSHVDHRGGVGELGAPIYCHPDERADAEGPGGWRYAEFDRFQNQLVRDALPQVHEAWDGGPVRIAGDLRQGDVVHGFEVIHLPGHAPGLIALFRASDRLLLASDTIYTIDGETGQDASARVPHPALNWDTELARESGQRRKDGSPFLTHPLEVAGLVWSAGAEEEVVAAAVLHDVLERTPTLPLLLQEQFGERVAQIVLALTQDERIDSYQERKAALRSHAIAAGPDAQLVFAADKISKTRELRARLATRAGRAPTDKQRARLQHYEASLQALQQAAPRLRVVEVLALELWSLHTLPPARG